MVARKSNELNAPVDHGGETVVDKIAIDHPRIKSALNALQSVTDPEIPVLNVVDMGIIADVRLEDSHIAVDITPTFVGCPAVDVIRQNVVNALRDIGEPDANVRIVFDPPWTSDRLTPIGRQKLAEFGIAPPGDKCGQHSLSPLDRINCPFCQSNETELESIFGPTLCRSIHYCRGCQQSFEHFKPVG